MKTKELRITSNLGAKVLGGFLLLALAGIPAWAQNAEATAVPSDQPPGAVGYDIETGQWLFDSDGDSFPDLTEELGGTDPRDGNSNPLNDLNAAAAEGGEAGGETRKNLEKVGFQQATCRAGFYGWAPRLCITLTQNATNYMQATATCRARASRLCSYEDLTYLYLSSSMDAVYDPSGGKWLGDFVQNDFVNCGDWSVTFDNDPNIWNFEGTCSKWDKRAYWCCHDRI